MHKRKNKHDLIVICCGMPHTENLSQTHTLGPTHTLCKSRNEEENWWSMKNISHWSDRSMFKWNRLAQFSQSNYSRSRAHMKWNHKIPWIWIKNTSQYIFARKSFESTAAAARRGNGKWSSETTTLIAFLCKCRSMHRGTYFGCSSVFDSADRYDACHFLAWSMQ